MTAQTPGVHEQPLATLALRAARAGTAAIAGVVARGEVRPDVKTGAHDLVTAADRASEAAIIEVIRAERPDDAILGEESGAHAGSSASRWLVDPLDGTANFVYGRPDFAVSVGVETAGTIVAGAIIRPSDGRWVLADVTASEIAVGAELSPPQTTKLAGRQHVSSTPSDEVHAVDALVSFGLPYAMSARQAALAIIRAVVPHVRGVRIAGSAACDFLAWAHGECDAFVGCGLAEWDTAAGQAIVLAAGGAVRSVATPDFDILVAASPPLAAELCDIVGSGEIVRSP
jgi:myo-inositol-1(or 4)-monophosphatase